MRRATWLYVLLLGMLLGVSPLLEPVWAQAAPPFRLAVVELRNGARLTDDEVMYLTDLARTQASRALPGDRFLVMTRESIVALLPPGKTLAECSKGQCEVEVGRTIGADYIVTGDVLRFGEELRLNLKVHACQSGAFLGSEPAKGSRVNDLEAGLVEASGRLFAAVRAHAGVGVSKGYGPGGGVPGPYGNAPEKWKPNATPKKLVHFISDPPGAMVIADGAVLCQSTPCSKLVPTGVLQVQMQQERHAMRAEVVKVPETGDDVLVEWRLSPTYGWLTVHTTPEKLAILIDGDMVRAPVERREVDSGLHDVRVVDPNYYEYGENVSVGAGEDKRVELRTNPRVGAIEITAIDGLGNDVPGQVFVDGSPLGDAPGTLDVMRGSHLLAVVGRAGGWRDSVTIQERTVTRVTAKLIPDLDLGNDGYELLAEGTLVRRGNLMWTVSDNGSDVNWREAKNFCANCRVGGYQDWRMPTIEELEGLYDARQSDRLHGRKYDPRANRFLDEEWMFDTHIAKPFRLTTPWVWSSTRSEGSEAYYFRFDVGERLAVSAFNRVAGRVLCVRRVTP